MKAIRALRRKETEGLPDPPAELGEMNRTKSMIAAAVKVWWLKRGSRDEGRDGRRKNGFTYGRTTT